MEDVTQLTDEQLRNAWLAAPFGSPKEAACWTELWTRGLLTPGKTLKRADTSRGTRP